MTCNSTSFLVGLMVVSAVISLQYVAAAHSYADVMAQQQLSPGYQCKALGYAGSCRFFTGFMESHICNHLYCAKAENGRYIGVHEVPAAVGTPCGRNNVCDRHRHCFQANPGQYPFLAGDYDVYICEDRQY